MYKGKAVSIDFSSFPDLYPPIALTCERLAITLHATGTERLRYKECDRIEAVQKHEVRNDHRMAMALMCADYPVTAEEKKCIAKSYPTFVAQFNSLPSGRGGVGSLLQIAEYAAIQELTMRMAKAGAPIMCSGANLIVRREAWLECEPDLHPEIPSGDDMFLLEAMKKRGMKITVMDEADYTAVVHPAPTWRAFFRQRMRWAGKAPKYTDPDILRCGAFIVAVNLLQLLFPPFILIKFPVEYSFILRREPHTKWYVALLLEILYPFYMLISLLGGLFRQKKW